MKLTTKQLKKLIQEELSIMMEMNDKIRELEDKIEMIRQYAEDTSDGDPELAEKVFIQHGGDKFERELESLKMNTSPSIGLGPKMK